MQSVRHLDRAALAVVGVVELGHRAVEARDDLLGDAFGVLRHAEDDEVVAADVADEGVVTAVLLRRGEEDARQRLDRLVAAGVAVVVVEGLEVIDVDLEHRERRAGAETALELLVDRVVAGQSGERAGGTLLAEKVMLRIAAVVLMTVKASLPVVP